MTAASEAARLCDEFGDLAGKGYCGRLVIRRPWSADRPKIQRDTAVPASLRWFYEREFAKLLARGAAITVLPGSQLPDLGDHRLPRMCADRDPRENKLVMFPPARVLLATERLLHYTGTRAADFQRHVVLVNYGFQASVFEDMFPDCVRPSLGMNPQMPAWHSPEAGISLVVMGVGPANALTLMESLLAAARPDLVLLAGHCGGLRNQQAAGDLVLADSYIRDDGVLDEVLHPLIPVVPELELLQLSMEEITERGLSCRRGTAYCTAMRNWDWRLTPRRKRLLRQGRAVASDMESAVIAGYCQLYRTWAGTLLWVTDKPLHGKPKLAEPAREIYADSSSHLDLAAGIIRRFAKTYPDGP